MSSDEELDALIDALIKGERGRAGPNADDMKDVWSGIERRLPPDTGERAGDAKADAPHPDPSAPAPDASSAVSASDPCPALHDVRSTAAHAVTGGIRAVGWKMAGVAIASTLVGGAGGAFLHARLATPVEVIVERPVAREPAAAASPVAPAVPVSSASADAVEAPLAPAPKRSPRIAPTAPLGGDARTSADDALARERSLLDMGRTALARGDADAALAAVRSLEREAPHGQLVEEREVLAIQSLLTANRHAEAQARATRFRTTYPSSPLLDVIDDTMSP